MENARIAWAAGLYEAEGCIYLQTRRAPKGSGAYRYPNIRLGMTDRVTVERFMDVFACGKVYPEHSNGFKQNGDPCKPISYWGCTRTDDVRRVCSLMRPYLSPRRIIQIDAAIAETAAIGAGELDWLSWAAGLYEGEGYITRKTIAPTYKGVRYAPYYHACIGLNMTDREPVERMMNTMGCGHLARQIKAKTKPDGTSCKPLFLWRCTRRSDVEKVSALLRPYLSARRIAQIDTVLNETSASRRPLTPVPPCGLYDPQVPSNGGYKYHRKRGEAPCEGCMNAVRLYKKRYQAEHSPGYE